MQYEGRVTFGRTFTFKPEDLLPVDESDDTFTNKRIFLLGLLHGEYYTIRDDILGLKYHLLLHRSIKLPRNTFIANSNISIFRKIDELIEERVVVGGDTEVAIPFNDFKYLVKKFPTTTEIVHYSHSRISRVLRDYFHTMSDAQQKLNAYLNRDNYIPKRELSCAVMQVEKYLFI